MHTSFDGCRDPFPPARWRGGWRAKRAGWGDFCWLGARIVPPPRPHSLRSCGRPSPPTGGRVSPPSCVHPLARPGEGGVQFGRLCCVGGGGGTVFLKLGRSECLA